MMTRQGLVTYSEAEKSFTLAAKEVLPQLQGAGSDRATRRPGWPDRPAPRNEKPPPQPSPACGGGSHGGEATAP